MVQKGWRVVGYAERNGKLEPLPVGRYGDYKTADLAAGTWLKSTPGAKEAHIERFYEELDE